MGKIRKKTSKRGTTNRRAQIKQKVKETHRKSKRDAKKNPQWKSKQKKDPGIPNNFPYKEQVLAEIAEEQRRAEEAKQLKKEQKKGLRAQAKAAALSGAEPGSDDEGATAAAPESEEQVTVGDAEGPFRGFSVLSSSLARASAKGKAKASPEPEEVEMDDAPLLLDSDWPHMSAVLDEADVFVQVLDAREPLAFRSTQIEKLAQEQGKKVLFVLNKIDTCPREYAARWAAHLRASHPTVLFRSASAFLPSTTSAAPQKGKSASSTTDAWGIEGVQNQLKQWASGDLPLKVAVLGLTNSGKSSFINSLIGRATLPTYVLNSTPRGPSTTPYAVSLPVTIDSHTIHLIDTPGLTFSSSVPMNERTASTEARRSADILLRARGRLDKLHDPQPALAQIVQRLTAPEDLMLFYSLPAFDKSNTEALSASLARSLGFVKTKGVLDHVGAARAMLRDWGSGKLPRASVPPEATAASKDSVDDSVLPLLKSVAEMRKGGGLVRLTPIEIEDREVDLEEPWAVEDESDEEDEDEEMGGGEGEDEDEDEEDEEMDDE